MTLLLALLLAVPTVALSESGPVKVGAEVPWFAGWTDADAVLNRTRLLADADPGVKGHVLVVFATWCVPCAAGIERLAKARGRLRAAGLRVVLVDYREEAAVARRWVRARGINDDTPLIVDRFGKASAALGAIEGTRATLPRTVVLDRAGVVRGLFGAEGEDYIERVIAAGR